MLVFSVANWNNFPSGLVRKKTPALRYLDTVDSSAVKNRVTKVGAKTHPCFSPWFSMD